MSPVFALNEVCRNGKVADIVAGHARPVRDRLAAGAKWIRISSSARETRPYGSTCDPEAEIVGLSLRCQLPPSKKLWTISERAI